MLLVNQLRKMELREITLARWPGRFDQHQLSQIPASSIRCVYEMACGSPQQVRHKAGLLKTNRPIACIRSGHMSSCSLCTCSLQVVLLAHAAATLPFSLLPTAGKRTGMDLASTLEDTFLFDDPTCGTRILVIAFFTQACNFRYCRSASLEATQSIKRTSPAEAAASRTHGLSVGEPISQSLPSGTQAT